MNSLSKEEKDLILDFYFRCGDEDKINEGRDLVAANPDAALLYARLEDTLTQLDDLKYEPCPENLVELTVARLKLAASSGHTQLHKLLELEQQKDSASQGEGDRAGDTIRLRWGFRDNLVKTLALAAMIMVVASVAFPTLSNMRHKAWRTLCMAGLGRVAEGVSRYANENDGLMPSVATAAGDPWWRAGESNNQHPFLLVRGGYVLPKNVVCAGNRRGTALDCSDEELRGLRDFPSRNNFTYSYRIMCPKSSRRLPDQTCYLMSDLTPVFEEALRESHGRTGPGAVRLRLSEELLRRQSSNHRDKGQNIMSSDGSVRFYKVRILNGDDVFTIRKIRFYEGREVPIEENDTFLAP